MGGTVWVGLWVRGVGGKPDVGSELTLGGGHPVLLTADHNPVTFVPTRDFCPILAKVTFDPFLPKSLSIQFNHGLWQVD